MRLSAINSAGSLDIVPVEATLDGGTTNSPAARHGPLLASLAYSTVLDFAELREVTARPLKCSASSEAV
jgi:hypothetical protein